MTPGDGFKLGGVAVALLLGGMTFFGGFYQVDGGNTSIIQNTMDGSMDVVRGPAFGLKIPFVTTVYNYRDVSTLSFGDSADANTRNLPATKIRFADTYTADINVSFRFKLPVKPDEMIRLHQDFRSYDNMVDALLVKNSQNVTVLTATQYTGEEFFQGAQNSYKERLEDQMQGGIFETVRQQVEVEQLGFAPVSGAGGAPSLETAKQLVWKTVPVNNPDGTPRRQRNPLQTYGVEVTQVTLGNAAPEELLDTLLTDKKTLVAKRIRTIQEQETAQAEADTEQLRKEIERTKAVQDANRLKELAIIAEQQQVDVAKQIALKELVEVQKTSDVAVIEKKRELDIASANRGIQEANSQAAIFQAQANKEIGLADAEVLNAKYQALGLNKEIYLAEVQRDISLALYNNLANFKVTMPQIMTTGSDNGGMTTNLDILSSYAALGVADRLAAPAPIPSITAAPVVR